MLQLGSSLDKAREMTEGDVANTRKDLVGLVAKMALDRRCPINGIRRKAANRITGQARENQVAALRKIA